MAPIVAYSAICRALNNSRRTSFLTYREAPSHISGRDHVITCCGHASVYDPAEGANVLSGLAEFPLAAVQLKYHADADELTAGSSARN